jgi:hypothetical protein
MKINLDKKYKYFNRASWKFFILGAFFFVVGIYAFFFKEPNVAINLKTQQPYVANGTILLILGLGFISIGLYRIIFKAKVFKNEIEIENEIGENDQKLSLKNMGYNKKRKRWLTKAIKNGGRSI